MSVELPGADRKQSQQISERTSLLKDMVEQIVQSPTHDFSNREVVPAINGVYIIHDKAKGIIYVGQSGNLRCRLFGEHLSGNFLVTLTYNSGCSVWTENRILVAIIITISNKFNNITVSKAGFS